MRIFSFIFGCVAILALTSLSTISRAEQNPWIEVSKEGSGPPVLLIPGLSSSADVWAGTAAYLAKSYTVYRVQVKGFAASPAAPGMDEDGLMDGLTNALASFIKDNDLKQPVIVGHSMGGYLALRLARDHPALISKAMIVDALPFYSVILNPTATVQNMKPIAVNYKAQLIAGAKLDESVRRPQQRQMLSYMVTGEDDLGKVVSWAMDSDAAVVGQAVFELMTSDLRGDLASMKTPTLVLAAWASGGPYTKTQMLGYWQSQYAAHTTAKVELMSPARHFIMLDQPGDFVTRVDAFLSEK